jgi:hypothetical protein
MRQFAHGIDRGPGTQDQANGDRGMCATCGCSDTHGVHQTTIRLEQEILARNQQLAEATAAGSRGLTQNLVSSPGSGKTTLLERTIRDSQGQLLPAGRAIFCGKALIAMASWINARLTLMTSRS